LVRRPSSQAEGTEVLDAGDFVAGCAVVLGELGFDDYLGVDLVGSDEVGRPIEAWKALGALGLAVADAGAGEDVFDGVLDDVSDQLADGVSA
jgi:hypothetical protein